MVETQLNSDKSIIKFEIVRMFTDEQGKSRFGTIPVVGGLVDFAPPAPKLYVSKPGEAKNAFFITIPPKWRGDYHPVPTKQYMTLVSGTMNVIASDGTKKSIYPGDTGFFEDTWGEGHISENPSDKEAIIFIAQV